MKSKQWKILIQNRGSKLLHKVTKLYLYTKAYQYMITNCHKY